MDNKLDLLRRLVDGYELLQASDGASVPIDGQGLYKAGQWVGCRLEGLMIEAREALQAAGYRLVALQDGRPIRALVQVVDGPALAGSPTAYCEVEGRVIWLVPGESVEFVEHVSAPVEDLVDFTGRPIF